MFPLDKIGVIVGPSCWRNRYGTFVLSYYRLCWKQTGKSDGCYAENQYIRTSISNDIMGTEYASMLKNIYAIASGIANALGYGDNFQRYWWVMPSGKWNALSKMFTKWNVTSIILPIWRSFGNGLFCFQPKSFFWQDDWKGYSVKTAQMEMRMVAEGYYATQCAKTINQNYSTRVPIIDAVFSILYLGKTPEKIFKKLVKKLDNFRLELGKKTNIVFKNRRISSIWYNNIAILSMPIPKA